MPGKHLTLEGREVFAQMTWQGEHPEEIASRLGCHVSTVYRERRRNGQAADYYPARAQALADERRRRSKSPWKMAYPPLAAYVREKLRRYWSPQQIAGRLRREFPRQRAMRVSHQALYEWIAAARASGENWHTYLRQAQRKRRKRYGTGANRGRIAGRVGIEARPAVVKRKARVGDWESDTIAGSGSTACLASHVERRSRYTVLAKLPDAQAQSLNTGTLRAFARHGDLPCRTTTTDNGKEFAGHAELGQRLGWRVYFARPYHAWERGLNENTNGLVRQFFPKGLDLAHVSDHDVHRVEALLNGRPRKCLAYRTPLEILSEAWPL